MAKYVFAFNPELCIGCRACEIACKQHNDLPVGIKLRNVYTFESGKFPKPELRFVTISCFHCSDPPCMKACPMDAIFQREDGIVLVDESKCIGCGYCLYACPFGAPTFKSSDALGSKGTMRKYTFCYDRIDKGLKPACATVCITGALIAGSAEEVSRIKKEMAASKLANTL